MARAIKRLSAVLVVVAGIAGLVGYLRSRPVATPDVAAVGAIADHVARTRKARPAEAAPSLDPFAREDPAQRGQIEAALFAAEALVRERVREAAEDGYPMGACSYTGRYAVQQQAKTTIRASMEFVCESWDDKQTGQARKSTLWWPARLAWDGSQWLVDPSDGSERVVPQRGSAIGRGRSSLP